MTYPTYPTFRKIFIKSPPKADIIQSRKVQSTADQAAHIKHLTTTSKSVLPTDKSPAIRQLESSMDKSQEELYNRFVYEEKVRKSRQAAIGNPKTTVEESGLPKEMANKTMQQLGAENPREFFRLAPDPVVGVLKPEIEGVTVVTQGKIRVRNGQWYRIMEQPEYYLQYCTSPVDGQQKCLVIDTTSVKPCYLVISASMSYNGGYDLVHLSPSLFQDLIEFRPPLAEILRVYRKTACSDVELALGAFDLTNAIPIWSTTK